MCFGKRFVTIILGDESQTKIICGFCSHGLEEATGTATVWEPSARIGSGVISGVSIKDGIKYEVGWKTVSEHYVFSNESDAEVQREIQYNFEVERSKKWFENSFINCRTSQIWSAGYHKNCIASAEKTIQWHKLRLGMIKEKENE